MIYRVYYGKTKDFSQYKDFLDEAAANEFASRKGYGIDWIPKKMEVDQ